MSCPYNMPRNFCDRYILNSLAKLMKSNEKRKLEHISLGWKIQSISHYQVICTDFYPAKPLSFSPKASNGPVICFVIGKDNVILSMVFPNDPCRTAF